MVQIQTTPGAVDGAGLGRALVHYTYCATLDWFPEGW